MKTAKIRVLHVIDSLDLGGAQVVLLNLIKYANQTRFELDAACLHGRGVFWKPVSETGASLRSLSFHHYFPSYIPALAALILRRRYQIVHCHLLASNIIAKPVAAMCGVPIRINHEHCNDKLSDPRPWALPADRWTNRFSTHVISVAESAREFVELHEGVPKERTTTIHNGIDCEIYQPRPSNRVESRRRWCLPENATIVGGIGRLTAQKNFELFLDVAAQCIKSNVSLHFAIAGTGEEEALLRKKAVELGITDRVTFLGFVSDMAGLYPALDMLLLTSRYEGLPITILEAMASGTPIIASKLDGIAEVLEDGVDAFLAPSGDCAQFSERVMRFVGDSAARAELANRAMEKVRRQFSAERMTREVEAIYDRYLGYDRRRVD